MRKVRRGISRVLRWFEQDTRRIVAVTLAAALLGIAALGYTWNADQQSERRSVASDQRAKDRQEQIVDCLQRYVGDLTKTSTPRTLASIAANNARYDWDRGYSKDVPGLTKDQLKDRYLRLYAKYQQAVKENPPLPELSVAYCNRVDQ